MSSPVRSASSRSHSPEPHWSRPCGSEGDGNNDYDLIYTESPETEILRDIILQAQISRSHAETFREEYVNRTFKVNFHYHHEDWSIRHLEWLPKRDVMPKVLGGDVPDDHLKKLVAEEAYKDIYLFLQQIAVGMEQVQRDQQNRNFREKFRRCNIDLNKLLCELQTLLTLKHVPIPPSISEDIMSEEVRSLDEGRRNFRDWLIFREYMNVLEYITQVLSEIRKKIPS